MSTTIRIQGIGEIHSDNYCGFVLNPLGCRGRYRGTGMIGSAMALSLWRVALMMSESLFISPVF